MNYIEERLYSEAFEDGVDYAVQRMFGGRGNNWKLRKHKKALKDARRNRSAQEVVAEPVPTPAATPAAEPVKVVPTNEMPPAPKTASNKGVGSKSANKKNSSNAGKEASKGSILGWIKKNPYKSAGIAAGLAAAGYGGYKFATRNKDEEEDED